MLRTNPSPALSHSSSTRAAALQARISQPSRSTEFTPARTSLLPAKLPTSQASGRMRLSRVKPGDPDTINTPRAWRSLPGQPGRTLFSNGAMEKSLSFQLSLEQTLGDERPAAESKQRNGPACSAQRADGTEQPRDVIKYVAPITYSVDRTDCLVA